MLLETEGGVWEKGHSIDEWCSDPSLNNIFSQVKVYVSVMLVLQKHVYICMFKLSVGIY